MNRISYPSLLVSLLILTACGGGSNSDDNKAIDDSPQSNYTLLKSDTPRDDNPQISDEQFETFNNDNRDFTWDLYHEATGAGENALFSPFSISTALAMTYAGAAGDTKTEMADTLNFTLQDSELHPAFNLLTSTLEQRELSATEHQKALTLNVNNAVWASNQKPPGADYLETLALNYGTGVYSVDFKQSEEARKTINDAVFNWTEELIDNLLPEGSIKTDTIMVLTNTIYLYAPWATPFEEFMTSTATFNNYDGSNIQVDTMLGDIRARYADPSGVQVVAIPYREAKLEMLLLLPDAGTFDTFEANLNRTTIDTLLAVLESSLVQLYLPKFSLTQAVSLKKHLIALGMPISFTDVANFTPMGLGSVAIDEVIHKAFLEVHEAGTEAAAATAVIIRETSIPVIDAVVRVDRPFVFLIRDEPTGNVLFVGRVLAL